MADDDPEDCLLLRDAVSGADVPVSVFTVSDGEALLECLTSGGLVSLGAASARPDLILLDLNMPRRDGRETLRALKSDRHLQTIPVVVLTTSTAAVDIDYSYELGANSYITKPSTFQDWLALARTVNDYWFRLVELPTG
ncbi:MAG: response regulator [Pirellulales bacterium]|nr:response regulator [Pirellulales bacterium]